MKSLNLLVAKSIAALILYYLLFVPALDKNEFVQNQEVVSEHF